MRLEGMRRRWGRRTRGEEGFKGGGGGGGRQWRLRDQGRRRWKGLNVEQHDGEAREEREEGDRQPAIEGANL